MNVVDVASRAPELKTLVKLLVAAGLVDTLKNLQNATIFAPVNSAFY